MEEILKKLQAKESRIDALVAKMENAEITTEERSELVSLDTEVSQLINEKAAIDKSKQRTKDRAHNVARQTAEDKVVSRFSLTRAVRNLIEGKDQTGAEAELHKEAVREAGEANIQINGFGLPSFADNSLAKRSLDAATAATAKNLIATDLYEYVPALAPMTKLRELGVTVWNGLRGDIEIPAGDAIATASFATELAALNETTPTTKLKTLNPKRLGAWSLFSLKLMYQSSVDVDTWLMNELIGAEERLKEQVAILGGGSNEPVGILGLAGTNVIALGTNGAALTRAKLIEMETAIATANASENNLGFLTTNGVRGFLRDLPVNPAFGPFVWSDNNQVLGYRAVASNLVPKNLTKGSGTNLNAVIFGDFSKLIVGNWGVRDIVVDNVTKKKTGQIEIIMNSFTDVQCVHEKGFSVIKDVLLP